MTRYSQHAANDPLDGYAPESCGQLKDQTPLSTTLVILAVALAVILCCGAMALAPGLVI